MRQQIQRGLPQLLQRLMVLLVLLPARAQPRAQLLRQHRSSSRQARARAISRSRRDKCALTQPASSSSSSGVQMAPAKGLKAHKVIVPASLIKMTAGYNQMSLRCVLGSTGQTGACAISPLAHTVNGTRAQGVACPVAMQAHTMTAGGFSRRGRQARQTE